MKYLMNVNGCDIYVSREIFGDEFWIYGTTAGGSPMTAPTLEMAFDIACSHGCYHHALTEEDRQTLRELPADWHCAPVQQ